MDSSDFDDQDNYHGATKGEIPPIKPSYLLKGIALSAMVSGYIIGPLLIFGGLGYWIHKHFHTSRIVLFGFVLFAFLVSNALIFIRSKQDAEKMMKETKDADKHVEKLKS